MSLKAAEKSFIMDLKRKLSSRKFWLCVCSLLGALLTAFNLSGSAAKVTAIIMAFGSVISYILAEGWVDAANPESVN